MLLLENTFYFLIKSVVFCVKPSRIFVRPQEFKQFDLHFFNQDDKLVVFFCFIDLIFLGELNLFNPWWFIRALFEPLLISSLSCQLWPFLQFPLLLNYFPLLLSNSYFI